MKFCKRIATVLLAVVIVFTAVFYYISVGGYKKYQTLITKYANCFSVDSALILATAKTESGFNEKAISKKGAIGLMQLIPSTATFMANRLGINDFDLYNAEDNIKLGVAYLRYLIDKFGSEKLAVIGYNCGEGTLKKWIDGGLINKIPYKETKDYLKKVTLRRKMYSLIMQ